MPDDLGQSFGHRIGVLLDLVEFGIEGLGHPAGEIALSHVTQHRPGRGDGLVDFCARCVIGLPRIGGQLVEVSTDTDVDIEQDSLEHRDQHFSHRIGIARRRSTKAAFFGLEGRRHAVMHEAPHQRFHD